MSEEMIRRRVMMAIAQGGDEVHKEIFTIERNNQKIIVNRQYEKFIFYAYTDETPPANYANFVSFLYDGTTVMHGVTNKANATEIYVNRTTKITVTSDEIQAGAHTDVFMTIGDWVVIQIPID